MKIDFSFPEGVAVRADRKLLTKIFMNLVGNAVAYIGSPDRPFVRVSVKENGKERTLSVSDNGLGIPEESRPGIFGKFKRGKNVEEIHGTGLGLSIVKAAVEAQGGTIRFESEEGKGTTFYFTLPKAG